MDMYVLFYISYGLCDNLLCSQNIMVCDNLLCSQNISKDENKHIHFGAQLTFGALFKKSVGSIRGWIYYIFK